MFLASCHVRVGFGAKLYRFSVAFLSNLGAKIDENGVSKAPEEQFSRFLFFFPHPRSDGPSFFIILGPILDPKIDKKTRKGAPKTSQKSGRSKNYFFSAIFRIFGRSGFNFLRCGGPNWVSGEAVWGGFLLIGFWRVFLQFVRKKQLKQEITNSWKSTFYLGKTMIFKVRRFEKQTRCITNTHPKQLWFFVGFWLKIEQKMLKTTGRTRNR